MKNQKVESSAITLDTIKRKQSEEYEDNFDKLIFENYFYDFQNLDIDSLKTDGYGDGGVDYILFTRDSQIIMDVEDLGDSKGKEIIDIHFIQVKETSKLSSDVPNKLLELTTNFFMNKNVDHYNAEIKRNINLFNEIKDIILPSGHFNIHFYYFGLFSKEQYKTAIDIEARFNTLEESLKDLDFINNVTSKIIHTSDIYEVLSKGREFVYKFTKIDKYSVQINEDTEKTEALIALIPLSQYYNFMNMSSSNQINTKLFESNIRDYKGQSNVNKDIKKTLEENEDIQFWWLNNGVTIIAEEIEESSSVGKILIKNPQIVNGLQTSYSIYNYFAEHPEKLNHDNRSVFIKMIQVDPDKEGIELDITKATNRQNEIRDKDIKANDYVQKQIELYFRSKSKYYQRKDKYYTNRKYPKKDIITLFDLAKYVYTIMFKDPSFTRTNPGKLLKEEKYKQIFRIDDHTQDYSRYYQCYLIYYNVNKLNKESSP